ncbi:kinase [Neobacillus sp. MER 74]|uniref:kinase n=1 Tax=unclassified Neobacillus TaxID=2675272 RepID=UPI00203B063F|nr:kinase [Neobacillus sp. MER 74]MCM3118281.1 kinase [Neobacillus sp. MER 74]
MNDFNKIAAKNNGKITLQDLNGFPMLGKGADGSVFQLSPEKCVKVYVNEDNQKKELNALQIGQSSSVIPRLYEYGSNYIVMELVNGGNLKAYLKKEKQLPKLIAMKILFMLTELKKVGFARLDTEVRHIFFNELGEIKVIDHKRAMTTERSVPTKLFTGLKKLGYLDEFLRHVKELNPSLYEEWKKIDLK